MQTKIITNLFIQLDKKFIVNNSSEENKTDKLN